MNPLILPQSVLPLALSGEAFSVVRPVEPQPDFHKDEYGHIESADILIDEESPFGPVGTLFFVQEDYWIDRREPNLIITKTLPEVVTENKRDKDNGRRDICEPWNNKFWEERQASTMPQWASRITVKHTGTVVKKEDGKWLFIGQFKGVENG